MANIALRSRVPNTSNPSSRRRSTQKRVSYAERSSESEDDDRQTDFEPDPSTTRGRSQPSQPSTQQPKPRTKRKASGPFHKTRLRDAKRSKTRNRTVKGKALKHQEVYSIQLTGRSMPWQTLPYHILASIFEYSISSPANDDPAPYRNPVGLVGISVLCKSFTEPALSALYRSISLGPYPWVKTLLQTLESQNENSTINYRAKIRSLYVRTEIEWELLPAIMLYTPQLRRIYFYLASDEPKFHKIGLANTGSRLVTLDFKTFVEGQIPLKDWTWNAYFDYGQCPPAPLMASAHELAPFRSLKSLTLINYHDDSLRGVEGSNVITNDFADALNVLPSLKSLSFKMSRIVNDRLLPRLPDDLESLEIINCLSVKSSPLRSFFHVKGHHLRRLELSHNRALNLSFLTDLAADCPKLEVLKMDLIYYSGAVTFVDTDPKYDALLLKGERPTWPASLQFLELYHLRKWKTETAHDFFSSLTDSASELPNLRQVKIKATLDESGWRDRVAFRDSWTQKLQDVFLRKPEPPIPHLKTIALFKAWKIQQAKDISGKKALRTPKPDRRMRTRPGAKQQDVAKLSHIEVPVEAIDLNKETDSDVPLSKIRRSTRPKPRPTSPLSSTDSTPQKPQCRRRRRRRRQDSDASSSEDSALDDASIEPDTRPTANIADKNKSQYIQGMCDVVDILIDNLRPTEEQLHESDFLDEEVSGDEDWNGDDEVEKDGYAW